MSLAERNRGLDTPDEEAVDCVFHGCIRTISQSRSRVVSAFEPELSEREPRREAAAPEGPSRAVDDQRAVHQCSASPERVRAKRRATRRHPRRPHTRSGVTTTASPRPGRVNPAGSTSTRSITSLKRMWLPVAANEAARSRRSSASPRALGASILETQPATSCRAGCTEAEVGRSEEEQRVMVAPGGEPVLHCLGDVIVSFAPASARHVHGVDPRGVPRAEFVAEHVAKLSLVRVPQMVALDRAEERGLTFQLPEHVDGIRPLGDRLGRCRTQILEEGGFHEECAECLPDASPVPAREGIREQHPRHRSGPSGEREDKTCGPTVYMLNERREVDTGPWRVRR